MISSLDMIFSNSVVAFSLSFLSSVDSRLSSKLLILLISLLRFFFLSHTLRNTSTFSLLVMVTCLSSAESLDESYFLWEERGQILISIIQYIYIYRCICMCLLKKVLVKNIVLYWKRSKLTTYENSWFNLFWTFLILYSILISNFLTLWVLIRKFT